MKTAHFASLHQQKNAFVICNVWDVASAKAAEQGSFSAIGTSSAAIASMLGYADGEYMAFEELLYIVKRIIACCDLPLTVDIEAGFSNNARTTASYIKLLAQAGVVGINIEDSKVNKNNGERVLIDANHFADFIADIKQKLTEEAIKVFINVRTDTFLLGAETALAETHKRAMLYKIAGADGLFVPCIVEEHAIAAVVKNTSLPVNVMCMPDLPSFDTLSDLGVKRISMGNFIFEALQTDFSAKLTHIVEAKSFHPLF
jgi:2-methylisocitrate lyase-like PEP mutase family enzyme